MEEEVFSFIDKHQMIIGPATVLVAVSGGPDSMALLHFLNRHKERFKIDVIALSIDHQLRGEVSRAEGDYVKEKCEQLSIPFMQMIVDTKAYLVNEKTSQQTASRKARYDAYQKALEQTGAKYLALGHHGDDQIETMLMALTKVTRPEILSGIPLKRSFHQSEIIRPLLCVNKNMIEVYCQAHKLDPRIDLSNEDLDYERNYFRKKIVPLLQARNPNLHKTAQMMSEHLQADNYYLNEVAQVQFNKLLENQSKPHSFSLKIDSFHKLAKPLQRRIYKLILDHLYLANERSKLMYEHEEVFMQLLSGSVQNRRYDFPLGLKLEKSYDTIHFYFEKKDEVDFEPRQLNLDKTIELGKGRKLTSCLVKEDLKSSDPHLYFCEKNSVKLPLKVRKRKPGDRISWEGLNGSKKLKDLFIDKKIPRIKRDETLIVTDDNDEVLWVIGLVKGIPKGRTGTGPYIKLEYKPF